MKGYYYFSPPGTPHYEDWSYFGSRNWHKGDGTPDPVFGEKMTVKQKWRDGSFGTSYPVARRVGDQACIENGSVADAPLLQLVFGVDRRCWDFDPPEGGIALGGDSPHIGLIYGGLALGGEGEFVLLFGGIALGGEGTFALEMPLPVVSAQAFFFGPIAAGGYVPILPFFWQVNKNGDGVNFRFNVPTSDIVTTPPTSKLYQYKCTVLFTATGPAPAIGVDFVEVVMTDGVVVCGQGMAYFEPNVAWGAGVNSGAGNGYWAEVELFGVLNNGISNAPAWHLEIKSTVPGFIDQCILGPFPSVSNFAIDWEAQEIADYP